MEEEAQNQSTRIDGRRRVVTVETEDSGSGKEIIWLTIKPEDVATFSRCGGDKGS